MPEYWEKTIELFSPFIDYPQMTERHLKRPPFKYIFHIFLSSTKKTGFADGLLSEEELAPEYYSSPEKKMVFLKKLSKFIYSILEKNVPVKPASIIKGIDCDKTNLFLQDMYEVATSGVTYNSKEGEKENVADKPPKEETETLSKQNTKELSQESSKEEVKVESERKEEKRRRSSKNSQKHGKVVKKAMKNVEKEEAILKKDTKEVKNVKDIKMGKLSRKKTNTATDLSERRENTAEFGIEDLKQNIQKITQNTNPLGKVVEFIDDDLENMNKECIRWIAIHREVSEKLEKIEMETEREHKKYYNKILELDEQIYEQESKIRAIKSQVFKNNIRVDDLLGKLS